jgi:hypothetical protein
VFPAYDVSNQQRALFRYIVLTQCNILFFEQSQTSQQRIKLIQQCRLKELKNIKKKKHDQRTIIFTWRDVTKEV